MKKSIAWVVIVALLNPVFFVPQVRAYDTDIYLSSASTNGGEPNILLSLDTSDSMNIPEPWREYCGEYDSHAEYLTNDYNLIYPWEQYQNNGVWQYLHAYENQYGISWGPAPAQPRYYWGTWAGSSQSERQNLASAAYSSLFQVVDGAYRYLHRNYGLGAWPTRGINNNYTWNNGRAVVTYLDYYSKISSAAWIYWLPAGTPESDPRLQARSFNRFVGAPNITAMGSTSQPPAAPGNGVNVWRGGINFGPADIYESYNQCASSKANFMPSTVFAPTAYPKNSGKWLNHKWARWERFQGLKTSDATAGISFASSPSSSLNFSTVAGNGYPGSGTAIATINAGNVAQGYLHRKRNNFGQPIKTQDGANSYAAWAPVRSDMANPTSYTSFTTLQYNTNYLRDWILGQGTFTNYDYLIDGVHYYYPATTTIAGIYNTYGLLRTRYYVYPPGSYTYNTISSQGFVIPSGHELFVAWNGATTPTPVANSTYGVSGYYDAVPEVCDPNNGPASPSCIQVQIQASTCTTSSTTITRNCIKNGTNVRDIDAKNQTLWHGASCDNNGAASAPVSSGSNAPAAPADPSCGFTWTTDTYYTGYRNYANNCRWVGRQSTYKESLGSFFHGGTCTGYRYVPNGTQPGSAVQTGPSTTNCWIDTTVAQPSLTIDGINYSNVVRGSNDGGCNNHGDLTDTCVNRFGTSCNNDICPAQATSVNTNTCATGQPARYQYYPVYNRAAADTYMVHDCKDDEGVGTAGMNSFGNPLSGNDNMVDPVNQKRTFGTAWNIATATGNSNLTAPYTPDTSSFDPPAIDVYSVNYLNWKYGPRGPNNCPIARKTRLQVAKDALYTLIDNTNGVRYGLLVFNKIATDFKNNGGNIAFAVKRMGTDPADPDYVNRAALKQKIASIVSVSRTPLTETLYEAYLYFSGKAPKFGILTAEANKAAIGGGTVGSTADPSALNGAVYDSPLQHNLDPNTGQAASCQRSYVVVITDGGPEDDTDANADIKALPAFPLGSDTIAADLSLDTIIPPSQKNQGQFAHPTNLTLNSPPDSRYGPRDLTSNIDGGYVWLDELAYYMGTTDLNSDINDIQNVVVYSIGFSTADSPVLQNAANVASGNYYLAEKSADLAAVLSGAVSSIKSGPATIAAGTVPISALNRTQSSNEAYLAFFGPSVNKAWDGTVKKFHLGVGNADCGNDPSGNSLDLCLIGQTTLNGIKNIEEAVLDPVTHQVVGTKVNDNAVSFWDPSLTPDGANPRKGGTGLRLIDNTSTFKPDDRNMYTYIAGVSTTTDLSATSNALKDTNTALITKARLAYPGSTYSATMSNATQALLINFARGGDVNEVSPPAGTSCSDDQSLNTPCVNWRQWVHADVIHSKPELVTYNYSPLSQVLYYLSTDGILHAINPADTSGRELWSFMVEEGLPKIQDWYNVTVGSHADIIAADGSPVSHVVDSNGDGIPEEVLLFFGLRRGGRAYYALDVTNPTQPRFKWKINNTQLCNPSCASETRYEKLGQTWSTPVVTTIRATQTRFGSSRNANDPVLIFGGGYDPKQDCIINGRYVASTIPINCPATGLGRAAVASINDNNNNSEDLWGRAIFVVEAKTGQIVSRISDTTLSSMTHSIPGDVGVYNTDQDSLGLSDRIYAADMNGGVFRFDINDANPANWGAAKLADLNGIAGTDPAVSSKKIIRRPAVVIKQTYQGDTYDAVYVGTGDTEHPLSSPSNDKMFMIKDRDTKLTMTGRPLITYPGGFVDITNLATAADIAGVASRLAASDGWYLSFEPGEKMTNNPIVFNQVLRFATYRPNVTLAASCSPSGQPLLYSIDATNGTVLTDNNLSGGLDKGDRTLKLYTNVSGLISDTSVIVSGTSGKDIYLLNVVNGAPILTKVGEIGTAVRVYWYREPEQ